MHHTIRTNNFGLQAKKIEGSFDSKFRVRWFLFSGSGLKRSCTLLVKKEHTAVAVTTNSLSLDVSIKLGIATCTCTNHMVSQSLCLELYTVFLTTSISDVNLVRLTTLTGESKFAREKSSFSVHGIGGHLYYSWVECMSASGHASIGQRWARKVKSRARWGSAKVI